MATRQIIFWVWYRN